MRIIILLTLFSSSLSTSVFSHKRSISDECPAEETIPKCSCSNKYGGIEVICNKLQTDADLQSHLNSLKGYELKKLEISGYNASSIPTDIYKGLEIGELSLSNVEVKDASFRRGKRHFEGLENSLNTLEIRNSFRNGHRPLLNLQLDHLKNLQHIIFEDNHIPEVGNDWFTTGPENAVNLIFEKNSIEEFGDQAFSSLNNLKLLAVAGNHLQSISRSMLPKSANKLKSLDLAYNKIRNLPSDIFSGMSSLEEINLDYNFIHVIQQETWGSISSQLRKLNLLGNVLQCDENIQWICETKLSYALAKCAAPAEKRGLSLRQFCKQ